MSESKSLSPTESTHPVVQEIVDELVLDAGRALLPGDRFDAWVEDLPRRYPRAQNPTLYAHLVALSLQFAPRRWPAAAQLYALSSL